jgi:hypothetical protein
MGEETGMMAPSAKAALRNPWRSMNEELTIGK